MKIVPDSATIEAYQKQELDDDSLLKDVLDVKVFGDEQLLESEYMAVKSYEGNDQAFDMYRIVTDTTPDKTMSFTGMSLAPYELNGHILQDLRPANHSLEYTLNRVLNGTDWRLGYIDDGLKNVTTNFYYVSVKEALKELQSLVGCEFVFKVEISGQKITDKWVEVYREMGNRTKKRFNYGTNALTVVRETNKSDIYTALIGRGKGEEVSSAEENESGQAGYGRKITFDEVEWSTAKGDPLDKPRGQYYLEMPQATLEYGMRNVDGTLSPRIGIVEFNDEEDPANLLRLTYEQLKVSARPKVLFKTTVANIGATGIGDTVTIHRHDLNMHYQTRVRKVVRNKLNDNKTQIELGDTVVTPSTKRAKQNNATIKNLKQELGRTRQEITETRLSADGKTNNHYGRAEPERKRTGDTWYRPHPSIAGEMQMLIWNGEAWELLVDTSDLEQVKREIKDEIEPYWDAYDKKMQAWGEETDKRLEEFNQSVEDKLNGVYESTIAYLDTYDDEITERVRNEIDELWKEFQVDIDGIVTLDEIDDLWKEFQSSIDGLVTFDDLDEYVHVEDYEKWTEEKNRDIANVWKQATEGKAQADVALELIGEPGHTAYGTNLIDGDTTVRSETGTVTVKSQHPLDKDRPYTLSFKLECLLPQQADLTINFEEEESNVQQSDEQLPASDATVEIKHQASETQDEQLQASDATVVIKHDR